MRLQQQLGSWADMGIATLVGWPFVTTSPDSVTELPFPSHSLTSPSSCTYFSLSFRLPNPGKFKSSFNGWRESYGGGGGGEEEMGM